MFDGDLLAERARVTPERLALVSVETGERLTYAELDARAERAAARLRTILQPGDRFGLLAYNCVEFLELFFAAGKAGVIVVPLSTRATEHELRHIAQDCEMRALFYGPGFENVELGIPRVAVSSRAGGAASAAERGAGSPPRQPGMGGGDPAPSARRRMTLSGEHAAVSPEADPASQSSICHPERSEGPVRAGGAKSPSADPESTWCLLYTSGTTGKPKGVMIPRRQLYWNGYNTAINWGLRDDDVTPVFTPLYHAGGLAAFCIPVFCTGGTVVLHKSFDSSEVWRVLQQERCTVVLGVPTIWKLLLDAPEFATADLSHVRWFISGGAPLPQFLIDAYQRRGVVFKQGYGMTEAGVNCFTMTVEDSFRKPGSIGRPMMFTEVKIMSDDAVEVATGEVGEMWIRGPHVAKGYWNNPAATAEAFTEDGWLRTGDLARRDEEGFFYIAGRRKEMFISGGVNVYPAEIEAELVSHPAVSDAAVIAVPDATWGESGVAFVVATATAAELSDYLMTRIAKYKVPRRIVFVDALPRTAYGKVIKEELRKQLS